MSDTTIYTSVFGGYERVWSPLRQDPAAHCVLLTDDIADTPGWEKESGAPKTYDSPRLANRFQKMLYFRTLPHEGVSVYVDANVRPINSLSPLFDAFQASGADLGMYRHYARASVSAEARACLLRNKVDNPAALEEELAFYTDSGFPDSGGMWEGSVIFKKHSSRPLLAAMEEWWELYSRFQTRDQFSLPFVIWKHGLTVFDLDSHSPGREHYFVRLQHSQQGLRNRTARYLQARAPENWLWRTLYLLAQRIAKAQNPNE